MNLVGFRCTEDPMEDSLRQLELKLYCGFFIKEGYRDILETAERCMVTWYVDKGQKTLERRAARLHGAQCQNGGRGGALKETKKEPVDRGEASRESFVGCVILQGAVRVFMWMCPCLAQVETPSSRRWPPPMCRCCPLA